MKHGLLALSLCLAFAAAAPASPAPPAVGAPGKRATDTCTPCHLALDDARLNAPAKAADRDIHHQQGITCAGCHGGDPTSDDPTVAMDPKRGFRSRFTPQDIPPLCGSCHSNAGFMLKYAPNIPTDQLSQYRTSKHGQALAKGDVHVATCISCHGPHGVLPPTDARSPVYPTHIVDTCAKCHSDKPLMAHYGIKGDEVEQYKRSVHYADLVEKNDLSAPTCKSCHGAHGATPPGISSVANVCGTCHVTQAEKFDTSPHKDAFAAIDQPACEACHSNHDIVQPQDAWIGVAEGQVCGQCHSAGDDGAKTADAVSTSLASATRDIATAKARVAHAERAGMLMDEAQVKLEDAHQALILARVEIHTLNPNSVKGETDKASAASAAADTLAAAAEKEIRYRRTGLFISLAVIAIAILSLIFKVRSIEK
jgi:predicted CXXCH cytochrome family protein